LCERRKEGERSQQQQQERKGEKIVFTITNRRHFKKRYPTKNLFKKRRAEFNKEKGGNLAKQERGPGKREKTSAKRRGAILKGGERQGIRGKSGTYVGGVIKGGNKKGRHETFKEKRGGGTVKASKKSLNWGKKK